MQLLAENLAASWIKWDKHVESITRDTQNERKPAQLAKDIEQFVIRFLFVS